MDRLWVVGVAISVALALGLTAFFMLARARRRQRYKIRVSVAQLLDQARRQGHATRLNWSEKDLDAYDRVRPEAQSDFPTAILPEIQIVDEQERP